MDIRIRNFFPFLNSETALKAVNKKAGSRFALDNAASTQLSLPVLEALLNASFNYANVHRGFYEASVQSGIAMERAYNTAANLVNAASWQEIVLGTNTTGMINIVAQGLRSQFEDGDNIVLTELEHSSNVGPWLGLKDSDCQVCRRHTKTGSIIVPCRNGSITVPKRNSYGSSHTELSRKI